VNALRSGDRAAAHAALKADIRRVISSVTASAEVSEAWQDLLAEQCQVVDRVVVSDVAT
jgi:hypothetical protein